MGSIVVPPSTFGVPSGIRFSWLINMSFSINAPVKVNLRGRHPRPPQDSDMGLSNHTGDSENSDSFLCYSSIISIRNVDLLGRDSDSVESSWQDGGYDRETFSQNSLGERGVPPPHRIHIDRCIDGNGCNGSMASLSAISKWHQLDSRLSLWYISCITWTAASIFRESHM